MFGILKRLKELEKNMQRINADHNALVSRIDNPVIRVQLDKFAFMPGKAHEEDAGYDIFTPIDFEVKPHNSFTIRTGVHMCCEIGNVLFIKSKSGLNVKASITSEGVVDAGYTGEIQVKLYNNSNKIMSFHRGNKITQIVPLVIPQNPVLIRVDELGKTDRGKNGFGSTGV